MKEKIMEKWKLSLKLGDWVWFVLIRTHNLSEEVLRGKLVPPDPGDRWIFDLSRVPGVSPDLPWCIAFRGSEPIVYVAVEGGHRYKIPANYLMQTEANAYRRVLADKRSDVAYRAERVKDVRRSLRLAEKRHQMALADLEAIQKKLQKVKSSKFNKSKSTNIKGKGKS